MSDAKTPTEKELSPDEKAETAARALMPEMARARKELTGLQAERQQAEDKDLFDRGQTALGNFDEHIQGMADVRRKKSDADLAELVKKADEWFTVYLDSDLP